MADQDDKPNHPTRKSKSISGIQTLIQNLVELFIFDNIYQFCQRQFHIHTKNCQANKYDY